MDQLIFTSRTFQILCKILSSIVILIGLIGACGWIFDIHQFRSILPTLISMKFNTAICFSLLGCIFYLLVEERGGKLKYFIIYFGAVLVLIVGLLTTYEFVSAKVLGIDEFFFIDTDKPIYEAPGRMALGTALNFIMTSLAALLMTTRILPIWSYQVCLGFIFISTLFAVLFYAGGFELNGSNLNYNGFAIHTIVAFILICWILILIRPKVGLSARLLVNNITGSLARILFPLFVISVFIGVEFISIGLRHKLQGHSFTLIWGGFIFLGLMGVVIYTSMLLLNKVEEKGSQIQQQLEYRERLFTEFTENMDLILWRMSPDCYDLYYISPAVETISGKHLESFYEHPDSWINLVVEEDRPGILGAINRVKAGASNLVAEMRILRADGEVRRILNHIFSLKDCHGKMQAILGISTDITEQFHGKMLRMLQDELHKNLSETQDITIFSTNILKCICKAIDYDFGDFWLVDDIENTLVCKSSWSRNELSIKSKINEKLFVSKNQDNEFPVFCMKQSTIQHVLNPSNYKIAYVTFENKLILLKEMIGLPLTVSGQNIGVMIFYNQKITHINPEIYKILASFTENFSNYLQNNILINKIQYIDNYDPLTGLYNRHSFINTIEELIQNKTPVFTIIKLKINNLQSINDTLGYDVGNKAFQYLTNKFLEVSSQHVDMIAILQQNVIGFLSLTLVDKEAIRVFADTLIDITKKTIKLNDMNIFLTVNLGISQYPEHGSNSKQLLSNAIWALIESSKEGSYQYQFATSDLFKKPALELEIETAMREALINNEFELYYQPQISLKTGKITGLEALIRWHDPQGFIRAPGYFMPICEKSELILEISNWVLFTAIKNSADHELQVSTAINLSARQFGDTYNLSQQLKQLLLQFPGAEGHIQLEVTETLMMSNIERTMDIVAELIQLNFQIALDDFGVGFSSFDHLRKFFPSVIKIDKSFIDGIPHDKRSMKIINAIIALSHSLDIIVVAEGVETAEQVQCLSSMGCDEVQGYYFFKPAPFNEIEAFIKGDVTFDTSGS